MVANINKWDKTAANNDDADPAINWVEGQAPSTVNNSARVMMSGTASDRDDTRGALTTGGTSTAYTVTTNSVNGTLQRGLAITVKLNATCGANPTFSPDTLTAKKIFIPTSGGMAQPAAGALIIGDLCTLCYDTALDSAAGGWIVQNYKPLTIALMGATTAQLTTNDGTSVPAAGKIGEVIKSTVASGSGASPASGIIADITTISITAGVWGVSANLFVSVATGDVLATCGGWISTASAIAPSATGGVPGYVRVSGLSAAATSLIGLATGVIYLNVTTTTTVYLSGFTSLASGVTSCPIFGTISAIRIA